MNVYYKHLEKNKIKEVKRGYSWTTFFFGLIPTIVRGDWKWFAIDFLFAFLIVMVAKSMKINPTLLSIPIWAIWGFFYNGIYEKELINKGYILME